MKKKEKSGHRKRLESKKRALKECASAVGQKSIFSMFGKKDSDTVEVENTAEVLEEGLLHDESSPPPSKVAKSDTTNVTTENAICSEQCFLCNVKINRIVSNFLQLVIVTVFYSSLHIS